MTVNREEWTPAADATLRGYRARGLSYSAIAQKMKRTRQQVAGRARRLEQGVRAMRVASPEEQKRILDLVAQGMSDGQVSKATGWAPTTIRSIRRRAGVRALCAGGASGRVVTAADREKMRAMRLAGMSTKAIAAEMGWSRDAVEKHTVGFSPLRQAPKKRLPSTRPRPQRLSEERRLRIIEARGSGRSQGEVAAAEGVGQSTVSYLWSWADEEYGPPPAPPSVEDRWAKLLRKRRFVDLEPWLIVPLGNRMPLVDSSAGLSRSSMAYA